MRRVLVTGATGYIGGHVVNALHRDGAEVVAVARRDGKRPADSLPVGVVEADIFSDPDLLFREIGRVDACVHLAWEAGFVHNSPVHMQRLSDHVRFLESAVRAGVPQLTVLGTMHEVGYHQGVVTAETPTRPQSQYGVAKNALRQSLEISLASSPVAFQWLRCFYIYGDDLMNNSVFTKIAAAARAGQRTFPFTSGTNEYDFIHVRELALQIAAVVQRPDVTGIVNCCSGEPRTLGAQVEEYIRDNGFDIRLEYGAFPDRDYDSPAIWGDASVIRAVMAARRAEPPGTTAGTES